MQVRSNRTFMELKWSIVASSFVLIRCSNRTFMELKLLLMFYHFQILQF